MKHFVEIFLAILYLNLKGIEGVLPPGIQVCKRNDPQLSECAVKNIINLAPRLGAGKLGGGFEVPQLDPFFIKEINFGEERGLKVFLRDLYAHGTSSFKIEKLRLNVKDLKIDASVLFKKLDINGKYRMSLNFLGSPATSEGDYYTTFVDPRIKVSVKAHTYLKNGVEFVKFDPIGIKFDRGTVSNLRITNLFGGNKVLGEIVHALLLNNPDFILKNFYPQLEALLSRQFTTTANKIVEKASFEELLPSQ